MPALSDTPMIELLLYGKLYDLGIAIGNLNVAWYALMLIHVAMMIWVTSYALCYFKKKNVPTSFLLAVLIFIAICPIYIGWTVVLSKEARYMVLLMFLTVLMVECIADPKAFFQQKLRVFYLLICCLLLGLTRENGLWIARIVLVILVFFLVKQQLPLLSKVTTIFLCCLVCLFPQVLDDYLIERMNYQNIDLYDYLSIPFQQTARVAKVMEETGASPISQSDKDAINTLLDYDRLSSVYDPLFADPVKELLPRAIKGSVSADAYIQVWVKQLLEYPFVYLDAFVNMNYVLFDLQSNVQTFQYYTDLSLHSDPLAFHDTTYFDLEQMRPLLSTQYMLTQAYNEFTKIPFLGWFATMGFCNTALVMLCYVTWIHGKKRLLFAFLPALIVLVMGAFCPIVYTRYLLPTMACLPLCYCSYFIFPYSLNDAIQEG